MTYSLFAIVIRNKLLSYYYCFAYRHIISVHVISTMIEKVIVLAIALFVLTIRANFFQSREILCVINKH